MKVILIAPLLCFLFLMKQAFPQGRTLNIPGMHQLINASTSEYDKQVDARNRQAVNTANEQANLTLLSKLKNVYRTLQERYNTLGTAINVANIGLQAVPMTNRIIANQSQIIGLVQDDPLLLPLGYATAVEFVQKAEGLIGYVSGLVLSLGDVNQMKASDRKILFDYVIAELSGLQALSNTLVNNLMQAKAAGLLNILNPFADFISQDKAMVEQIIRNAKYLRR